MSDREWRAAIAALGMLLATACDPGGGADDPLQPPIADLTGAWTVSERIYGNCVGVAYPEVKTYAATVAQDGNALVVVSGATGATLTGILSGAALSLNLQFDDGGGTLTGTFPGVASADGDAFGGVGTWSWSSSGGTSSCSGTSQLSAVRDGTSLPAPELLSARAGNSQVTLTWSEVIGASSYEVRRATTPGGAASAMAIIISYPPRISTTSRWLANGTPYYFVVTAVSPSGAASSSVEAAATPLASFPRPATPGAVAATPGAGKVTVSCAAVPAAAKYNVYRATAPGQMTSYASLQGHTNNIASTCSIPVSGLTAGTPYYFVVTAWNEDGESDPSTEVTGTPY